MTGCSMSQAVTFSFSISWICLIRVYEEDVNNYDYVIISRSKRKILTAPKDSTFAFVEDWAGSTVSESALTLELTLWTDSFRLRHLLFLFLSYSCISSVVLFLFGRAIGMKKNSYRNKELWKGKIFYLLTTKLHINLIGRPNFIFIHFFFTLKQRAIFIFYFLFS